MGNEYILQKLSNSKFRSRFKLKSKDIEYIKDKGLNKIRMHANDFITNRLSDTSRVIDGKQTPMKGHPVFIAQHATATCCRECLYKWHKIEKGRLLTDKEISYIVDLIVDWIELQLSKKG